MWAEGEILSVLQIGCCPVSQDEYPVRFSHCCIKLFVFIGKIAALTLACFLLLKLHATKPFFGRSEVRWSGILCVRRNENFKTKSKEGSYASHE